MSRFLKCVNAAASRRAKQQAALLIETDREIQRRFDGTVYVRYSTAQTFREGIKAVTATAGGQLIRQHLKHPARECLARLEHLISNGHFEDAREHSNSRFVTGQRRDVRRAARNLVKYELTEEQADAVSTDEDATLVLAGAGTGKTAVITAKIAYLVRHQKIDPGEILVLAFNRKAAAEIRERLPGDLRGACVATFHAFGMRLLGEALDRKPHISKLAEDPASLRRTIDDILLDLLTSSQHGKRVAKLLALHRNSYRSPFDFKTGSEYWNYVRRCELRTLSGDLVKSLEEVLVANFLSMNGIRFEYEKIYPVDTADARHRRYQPDFHLPDYDVYIEHFALDEAGKAPPHFRNYLEGVFWKRGIHRKYGTTLVETYSWQCRQGVLTEELEKTLVNEGVVFRPVSSSRLLDSLRNMIESWLSGLLQTFLKHVKTSDLSLEDLRRRAGNTPDRARSLAFLSVFDPVYSRYQEILKDEGAVDFEDLVNEAAEHLRSDRCRVRYRYILVDEFQDISAGRMKLLASLKCPGAAYFLVGDDWQSIYRFAGSDVGLVHGSGRYLGHVRKRSLSTTFRYGKEIAGPTSGFVRRNPEQTQRDLEPGNRQIDLGITVISSWEQPQGVRTALNDISRRERARVDEGRAEQDEDRQSVLALGRYNRSRNDLRGIPGSRRNEVEFSTVHSAKGRESDYGLVLDLKDDRMGFPSQIEDDPLLELVLPPTAGSAFPHAEERRLFYVAATRARRGVYLITDRVHPSYFVRELVQEYECIRRIGSLVQDAASRCPRCAGHLIESTTGKTLRCTNHPFCSHQAPRCRECDRGHVVIRGDTARCTYRECTSSPRVCARCKVGVLMLRAGRFGRFWGCSEYWSEPPCTYTEELPRWGKNRHTP